jgi:cysteine-rich secretory family protein
MQFVRVWLAMLTAVVAALPAIAQSQYTLDGTPTGLEEEIRWRANRGRFDSASENLLRGTAYTDVPASCGPLAPNQEITLAARHQSEDMAKANLFQHPTVPGSLYYNPVTQPNPWDRMLAEGYTWNAAAENIAAGYVGAEAVYLAWWNSTGHRENMYNSGIREIGNGFYNWSSSTYQNYYTMDLGSSGNNCFFTDTLFYDANGDGAYQAGEAVAGIALGLVVGSSPLAVNDISSSAGSFAIPLQSIASGTTVQVVLSNSTPSTLTLSIPRDYRNYATVSLAPGQSRVYGTFIQPTTTRNIGLRDIIPTQSLVAAPRLGLALAGRSMLLSWPSTLGLQYQPQWTTDCTTWTPLTNTFQAGTGGTMTFTDNSGGGARFYRLLVRTP